MRLAISLPFALLLAAAKITVATPSPSITTVPTASNAVPKTFITTATNCTHMAQTHSLHRRDPDIITSAPAVTESARPSVFTPVTCIGESNYGEQDGYVKHLCKTFEYKLKELESSAGSSVPVFASVCGMAGLPVVTMFF
ncbi:hypothetical protein QBC32DRAFT_340747 [Pseudoneurospora amorphoporcata]|uniref:Uncharacterized protein n=1 Tax=Pseudoneurospora amorphoporcata TaxID=241081 RepID=A0AAN6NX74_9PEZI|nr:hypothetical protein QBC32DRAFT_340747 [Pseudoneurospora amorphoporcata]